MARPAEKCAHTISSMAVTIIFGLMCATVLTMVVLPVIYAILYKLPYRRE